MKLFNVFRQAKTEPNGAENTKTSQQDQKKGKKGLFRVLQTKKDGGSKQKKKKGFIRGMLNKAAGKVPIKALRDKLYSPPETESEIRRREAEAIELKRQETLREMLRQESERLEKRKAQLEDWAAQVSGEAITQAIPVVAALRLQCWWRVLKAKRKAAELRAQAEIEAVEWMEEVRRLELLRKQALARYRQFIKDTAAEIYLNAVDHFKYPVAATTIQRYWRGALARMHYAVLLEKYRRWLQRQKELERYYAALRKVRKEEDNRFHETMDPAFLRQYGRKEWQTVDGWKPKFEADGEYDLLDYVWNPPKGAAHGVRTHKVTLPAKDEKAQLLLNTDPNTWVGLPVYVERYSPPKKKRVGPYPLRLDTTKVPKADTNKNKKKQKQATPSKKYGVQRRNPNGSSYFVTKYTWLPAPLVTEAMSNSSPKATLLASPC
mmetsp:Transcript_9124/g.11884  ORF Transcript_9124/g.11884 Transcript_9124/m.11884 type:complete len:434 (+) Transcript_9124:151-1452(+)